MAQEPTLVDGLDVRVRIAAVQAHDLSGETIVRQQLAQVPLRAPRFRKHDGLVRGTQRYRFSHAAVQRLDERPALVVDRDPFAQGDQLAQDLDLFRNVCGCRLAGIGLALRDRRGHLWPFLTQRPQRFEVRANRNHRRRRVAGDPFEEPAQGRRDRKCGRRQELAQHQGHQGPLAMRHTGEPWPTQEVRYPLVELLFFLARRKRLDEGNSPGEADVFLNLSAQRAHAQRPQPVPQRLVARVVVAGPDELRAERCGQRWRQASRTSPTTLAAIACAASPAR